MRKERVKMLYENIDEAIRAIDHMSSVYGEPMYYRGQHHDWNITSSIHYHAVVFVTVFVKTVVSARDEVPGKTALRHASVVDCDLGGCTDLQCVQQLAVRQKHGKLIVPCRNGVVDIREPEGAGELVTNLKGSVLPDLSDRDSILYRRRNLKRFLLRLQYLIERFNQRAAPPLIFRLPGSRHIDSWVSRSVVSA